MMKVVFHGYRDWALQIAQNLKDHQTSLWEIVEADEGEKSNTTVHLYYGWSWMLPPEVYTKNLCLILHLSPLPKYRGGSPLQNQIMNGEKISAATILKVIKKVDTGEIYSQTPFSLIGTLDDIFEQVIQIGTIDTIQVLNEIALGIAEPKVQDEKQATYYLRRKPEQSEITLKDLKTKTARQLYDFIRALADPYPNAYIKGSDGNKVYLTGAKLEQD